MNELTKYALKYSAAVFSFALFIILFFQCFEITRTQGISMLPTIKDGSIVLIRKFPLPSNLTGYLIVFKWNSTLYVLHRCLIDNGTHILTKGDNNIIEDGWTLKNNVIGIVKISFNLS
jgi:signal peptidase I